MKLDVRRSPTLSAAVEVMTTMPRGAAKNVRAYSKSVIQPEWKKGLQSNAPGGKVFQVRLVSPSAAYVSDRGVKLVSGRSGDLVRETEFGAYRETYNTYRRKGHSVTRRTQRQFWHYTKSGHVVYPTASDLIPRIASLWVQTIYRSVHDVLEKAGLK